MKDIHSNLPFKKGRRPSIVTDKKCCYYNYEGVNYSISKEKPSMTHSFDSMFTLHLYLHSAEKVFTDYMFTKLHLGMA